MRDQQRMCVWGSIVGLVLSVISVPGAVAQQVNVENTAAGARVYGDICGRCHNPRSPLERSDRAWVLIANHMRVRGNLTGAEVRSVIAFLQNTNTDPRQTMVIEGVRAATEETVSSAPVATDASTIAAGRGLVDEKACLGCHVIGDAGGAVGPSLNGVVRRRGAVFVRRKVANPTFNNATSMMPNFGLTTEQIEAVVAYLASLDSR